MYCFQENHHQKNSKLHFTKYRTASPTRLYFEFLKLPAPSSFLSAICTKITQFLHHHLCATAYQNSMKNEGSAFSELKKV